MECWGKARERVVKATFVGAGKEGLCPQMQNPRLRRGIFILTTDFLLDAVHPLDDFLAQQHQNTAAD